MKKPVVIKILDNCTSIEKADFLENIFGYQKKSIITQKIPIIIYGTGSAAYWLTPLLNLHEIKPHAFCNTYAKDDSDFFLNLPVLSLHTLIQKHLNSYIFVASGTYDNEIKKILLSAGFNPSNIFSLSPKKMFFYTHFFPRRWNHEDILKNSHKLQKTYDILADEKSKDLFIARIALLAGGADYTKYLKFIDNFCDLKNTFPADFQNKKVYTYHDFIIEKEDYYFDNELLKFKSPVCFVDCGAYNGDTARLFENFCKKRGLKLSQMHLFEPDPKNFQDLSILPPANALKYNLGVWSKSGTVGFSTSENFNSPKSAKVSKSNDETKIKVTSLDEILQGQSISFIKMDVEGAEIEALKGCKWTISSQHPKLSICVYHRRNDIFEVPLLINKLFPRYKIYLRHYSKCFEDTILFAKYP